jgi:hypothetical protein
MTNIETKKDGTKLTVTIDLSKNQGRSKTGKSLMIATTSGFYALGDGYAISINCIKTDKG